MQPILLIAGIAVGAGLLSTGFLANNNVFEVWIQDLGFGEGAIESPFDHVNVDFEVTATHVDPDPNFDGDEFFKNDITACSFHTWEEVDDGTDVICKLFSWERSDDGAGGTTMSATERVTVCEGRLTINNYTASDIILVDIDPNTIAYTGACDVQNIDFVKIVAIGDEPLSALCADADGNVVQHIETDGDGMYEPAGDDGILNTADDEICPV